MAAAELEVPQLTRLRCFEGFGGRSSMSQHGRLFVSGLTASDDLRYGHMTYQSMVSKQGLTSIWIVLMNSQKNRPAVTQSPQKTPLMLMKTNAIQGQSTKNFWLIWRS